MSYKFIPNFAAISLFLFLHHFINLFKSLYIRYTNRMFLPCEYRLFSTIIERIRVPPRSPIMKLILLLSFLIVFSSCNLKYAYQPDCRDRARLVANTLHKNNIPTQYVFGNGRKSAHVEVQGKLNNKSITEILNKSYPQLQQYNNNYRPIYHLESIFINILKCHILCLGLFLDLHY